MGTNRMGRGSGDFQQTCPSPQPFIWLSPMWFGQGRGQCVHGVHAHSYPLPQLGEVREGEAVLRFRQSSLASPTPTLPHVGGGGMLLTPAFPDSSDRPDRLAS